MMKTSLARILRYRTAILHHAVLPISTAALLFCGSVTWIDAQYAASFARSAIAYFPIQPMTQVNEAAHLGYFGDPYPIHLADGSDLHQPQYFSGTTQQVLTCNWPVKSGCFEASALHLTIADDLKASAGEAGNSFFDKINDNIYQAADGSWQMAVTLYLHKNSDPKVHWTVIAHAQPGDSPSPTPPLTWTADKILAGSVAKFDYANYDGKYFEDAGKLYLVYSKRLISQPAARDGIVAQEMSSPGTLSRVDPVVLLDPSTEDGGLNSEYFHTHPAPGDTFKLIETGNLIKIAGKYVMAYSAGDYQQLDYKAGVAFSDTLLPEPGETYRRILQQDSAGVWGSPEHLEVSYLLQSQKAAWPNYVANQVIAPGVPSVVAEGGRYLLFFDGFVPTDAPPAPDTPNNPFNLDPKHRRPFFVPLTVHIPAEQSVRSATDEELKRWITIADR
jgi:hypothetical protein